jgi:hypothetical protein
MLPPRVASRVASRVARETRVTRLARVACVARVARGCVWGKCQGLRKCAKAQRTPGRPLLRNRKRCNLQILHTYKLRRGGGSEMGRGENVHGVIPCSGAGGV